MVRASYNDKQSVGPAFGRPWLTRKREQPTGACGARILILTPFRSFAASFEARNPALMHVCDSRQTIDAFQDLNNENLVLSMIFVLSVRHQLDALRERLMALGEPV